MKTEKNLFQDWKENHLLVINCCKITEKGEVLWNEGIIINFLEKLGYRTLVIGEKVKFIQLQDNGLKETNIEEIKDIVLGRINNTDSQKIRMHLVRNNIFFSQELLYNLKEAIPDEVGDDKVYFNFDEGTLTVTQDEMYMSYWC